MNILLAYSRLAFDPEESGAASRAPDADAILARALHEALSERGRVTYIDASKEADRVTGTYDLFVGVDEGFVEIAKRLGGARKILFARKPFSPGREGQARAVAAADAILCTGNNAALNTYLAHGVPFSKIRMVNYGLEDAPEPYRAQRGAFLHRASQLGSESGLDAVVQIASQWAHDPRFRLEIVGDPKDAAAEASLQRLDETLGDRCRRRGWIDQEAPEYANLVARTGFLLLPATEGPNRAALEAIREGIVPLVSAEAGLDFSPLGFLQTSGGIDANRAAVARALELDDGAWHALSKRTTEYYRNYHGETQARLRGALDALIGGNALPKLSLILPIFNKEKTIEGLVRLLHRTCETYGNCEAIIIFDGCKDRSEEIVRSYLEKKKPSYPVTYRTTPNVFEVKSNNLGLELATGEYGVILQDDTYLYDRWCLHEAALYLNKNPRCAILGGLAGVNFYARGTRGLQGRGQILMGEFEVYWRQDADTDPDLRHRIYRTDACMRGPLILRKSFLEAHGYLDEAYVPLYSDDMDLGMRAASKGYTAQTMLMDTENKNLTQAVYSPERKAFFAKIIQKNADTFYSRWTFTADKSDYEWIDRVPLRRATTFADRAIKAYYVHMMDFSFRKKVVAPAVGFAVKAVRKVRRLITRS